MFDRLQPALGPQHDEALEVEEAVERAQVVEASAQGEELGDEAIEGVQLSLIHISEPTRRS